MDADYFLNPFSTVYLNIASQFIFFILIFKFFIDKSKKNPRFCQLASTLPGPPALPIIGNGLNFLLAGKGMYLNYFFIDISLKYESNTFR